MSERTRGNVLIMIPSGRRYQHDRVMIYDQPRLDYMRSYFNTGDLIVYDSILKLLEFADLDILEISHPTQADVDRYNSTFKYVILRGSNFINEEMEWENAIWVLERLQIPIYAIGVGAQAESPRKLNLSKQSQRVWSLIAEKSHSIGVRGSFSAEVLSDIGISNSTIIGCPSLFRNRDRDLKLKLKPVSDIREVAFSLRRETSAVYTSNAAEFLKLQLEMLLRVSREFDTTVTIHGEPEEKAFFYGDRECVSQATEFLRRIGWFTATSESELTRLYAQKLFLGDRVEDYDAMIRGKDASLGYRVHGVLPALANRVPSVMVSYDSRSNELAETFNIPTAAATELRTKSFSEIFDPGNFTDFEKNFPGNYDRMKSYLDTANIDHRM